MEDVLDRAEGGGDPTSVTLGAGKSKAAAYQRLKTLLRTSPAEISRLIETQMNEDFTLAQSGPGLENLQCSARAWIEHRSLLQSYAGPIRQAWTLGGIIDSLNAGDHERAKATALLALASLDQAAVDGGNWVLASEIALEGGPLRVVCPAPGAGPIRGPTVSPAGQQVCERVDGLHSRTRSVQHGQEELGRWGQFHWGADWSPSRGQLRKRRRGPRRREGKRQRQRQGQGEAPTQVGSEVNEAEARISPLWGVDSLAAGAVTKAVSSAPFSSLGAAKRDQFTPSAAPCQPPSILTRHPSFSCGSSSPSVGRARRHHVEDASPRRVSFQPLFGLGPPSGCPEPHSSDSSVIPEQAGAC